MLPKVDAAADRVWELVVAKVRVGALDRAAADATGKRRPSLNSLLIETEQRRKLLRRADQVGQRVSIEHVKKGRESFL